jgi:hypothetical protein
VLNRVYDSWDDALLDAGLKPHGVNDRVSLRASRGPITPKWSDEQLRAALRRCVAERQGNRIAVRAYDRWRKAGDEHTLPSTDIIRRRLKSHGTWQDLVTRVREEAGDGC